MNITFLTAWIRTRYTALKAGRDAGMSSAEMAALAGALLLGAAALSLALSGKLQEKIGIINGG